MNGETQLIQLKKAITRTKMDVEPICKRNIIGGADGPKGTLRSVILPVRWEGLR